MKNDFAREKFFQKMILPKNFPKKNDFASKILKNYLIKKNLKELICRNLRK